MTYEREPGEVGAVYIDEPRRDPDQQYDDLRGDLERIPLPRNDVLRSRILLARRDAKALVETFDTLLDEHTQASDAAELWLRSIEQHLAGVREALAYMARKQ